MLLEANLHEAVHLTQEQLEQAIGDENTKLPAHRTKPATWFGSSGDRAYIREQGESAPGQ